MLIWRHICFAMAFLIAQCIFKIVNVSQQRCPCLIWQILFSYKRKTFTDIRLALTEMPLEQLLYLPFNLKIMLEKQVIEAWSFLITQIYLNCFSVQAVLFNVSCYFSRPLIPAKTKRLLCKLLVCSSFSVLPQP